MYFLISIVILLAVSFIMALRSLRHELKKIEGKGSYELKQGIEVILRNF